MAGVLIKGGNLDTDRHIQREEEVKRQENAISKPVNAKDCHQTPEAKRQTWNRFCLTNLIRNPIC